MPPQAEPEEAQSRPVNREEIRDWTGYWIRSALRDADLPEKTIYSRDELEVDTRRLLPALRTGYYRWARWTTEDDVTDLYVRRHDGEVGWVMVADAQIQSLRVHMRQMDSDEEVQLDSNPGVL